MYLYLYHLHEQIRTDVAGKEVDHLRYDRRKSSVKPFFILRQRHLRMTGTELSRRYLKRRCTSNGGVVTIAAGEKGIANKSGETEIQFREWVWDCFTEIRD